MARWLGARLKRIQINRSEASGKTCVDWQGAIDIQEKELRVLAAARACMNAFNIVTLYDEGGWRDEVEIRTILDEMFPDDTDDDTAQYHRIAGIDAEVKCFFDRHDVRAAAQALAEILTRTNEIRGLQAESIIDLHLTPRTANG
jgi:hypothetical protein